MDSGQCGDVFSRSDPTTASISPALVSSTTLTTPSTTTPEDRQPPLTLARTDPVFRIPDDYIYFDGDDIVPVPDPRPQPSKRVRFPTNKATTARPSPSTFSNIQARADIRPSSFQPTKVPSIITSTIPLILETETNRTFPRSLFKEEGNSGNSIDFGQTFPGK